MKRLHYLFLLTALLLSINLEAESSSLATIAIRSEMLRIIDAYELNASLSSPAAKEQFLKLFKDQSTIICDVYNSPRLGDKITPEEYIAEVEKYCTDLNCHLSDIQVKSISPQVWGTECVVSAKKQMSFVDEYGTLFPIGGQLEDIALNFHIAVGQQQIAGTAKIIKIESPISAESFKTQSLRFGIGEPAKIVKLHQDPDLVALDTSVVTRPNGDSLTFNQFGLAYLPSKKLQLLGHDLRIGTNTLTHTDQYDIVELTYTEKRWRLRLRNEFAPMGFGAKTTTGLNTTYLTYNIGLDFGYGIDYGNHFSMSAFTGVAYSMSWLTIAQADPAIQYSTNGTDMTVTGFRQHERFGDIMIPIYANLEARLTQRLSLFLDLGPRVYFNLPEHHSTLTANINDEERNIGHRQVKRSNVEVTANANLGLWVRLTGSLFFEAHLGYEHTLTTNSLLNSSASNPVFFDEATKRLPFTISDTGTVQYVRQAADCTTLTRQNLYCNLGLMLRL